MLKKINISLFIVSAIVWTSLLSSNVSFAEEPWILDSYETSERVVDTMEDSSNLEAVPTLYNSEEAERDISSEDNNVYVTTTAESIPEVDTFSKLKEEAKTSNKNVLIWTFTKDGYLKLESWKKIPFISKYKKELVEWDIVVIQITGTVKKFTINYIWKNPTSLSKETSLNCMNGSCNVKSTKPTTSSVSVFSLTGRFDGKNLITPEWKKIKLIINQKYKGKDLELSVRWTINSFRVLSIKEIASYNPDELSDWK